MTVVIPAAAMGIIATPQAALTQTLQFQAQQTATTGGKRQRVKADLARTITTWRGTSDCRSVPRAKAALKPAVAAWLGGQLMARPNASLAAWGYHSGDVWSEARTVNGKPQCVAGFRKLIVYADFR